MELKVFYFVSPKFEKSSTKSNEVHVQLKKFWLLLGGSRHYVPRASGHSNVLQSLLFGSSHEIQTLPPRYQKGERWTQKLFGSIEFCVGG